MPESDGEEGKPAKRSCLRKQLRKTKMCQHFERGECKFGTSCAFAHTPDEIQHAPDLRKTRLCVAFAEGKCRNENCTFAHGEAELRSTDLFFKKTLCIWNEKGKCRAGDKCRFAHGQSEIREPTTPDGFPSLGSRGHPDSCGAPCRSYGRRGGCKDGATCPRCHLCAARPRSGDRSDRGQGRGRRKRGRDSSDESSTDSRRKRRRGGGSRLDEHGNSRPSWLRDDGAAAWTAWRAAAGSAYAAAAYAAAASQVGSSWGYPVAAGYAALPSAAAYGGWPSSSSGEAAYGGYAGR